MRRAMSVALLLSCAVAFAQAKKQTGGDPWKGTFKLDTSQSKFISNAPKDELVTVDSATKDSVKYTIKGTDAQGNPYTLSFEGKVGSASPQTMNGTPVAQVTYQMPSPREFISEARGSDGTASTGTVTLSNDNKTITVREQVKDAQGKTQEMTAVYVRQ
jgi:hypothetical protein